MEPPAPEVKGRARQQGTPDKPGGSIPGRARSADCREHHRQLQGGDQRGRVRSAAQLRARIPAPYISSSHQDRCPDRHSRASRPAIDGLTYVPVRCSVSFFTILPSSPPLQPGRTHLLTHELAAQLERKRGANYPHRQTPREGPARLGSRPLKAATVRRHPTNRGRPHGIQEGNDIREEFFILFSVPVFPFCSRPCSRCCWRLAIGRQPAWLLGSR
jgi:hypothetical protein